MRGEGRGRYALAEVTHGGDALVETEGGEEVRMALQVGRYEQPEVNYHELRILPVQRVHHLSEARHFPLPDTFHERRVLNTHSHQEHL